MNRLIDKGMAAASIQTSNRNVSSLSQIAGIQALFDLDATLSASYPGSGQTWANIIASPYDGSAQTGYDFLLGSTSSAAANDPTFNGTAGDSAAYWSFDGGDFFQIAAGNTAAINNITKTTSGQPVTIILAVKTPTSYSTTGVWIGTSFSGGYGFRFDITSASANRLGQVVSSSSYTSTPFSSTPTANNIHLMALAIDFTAGTLKTALDARTFSTKTLTKNPSTTDATNALQIGAAASTNQLTNTSQMFGCYVFGKILSDSELSSVIDVLNSRHNRTYA